MMDAPPNAALSHPASFESYVPLIRAADGLTMSQVCALTGLEQTTIQNWIKRGFVPHPERKKYRERHIARILLINALRDCMQIDRVGELMTCINGNADDISDDLIPEDMLYRLFCEVVEAIGSRDFSADGIRAVVGERLRSCVADEHSRKRIEDAMAVMSCAYIASQYKKEADRLYEVLIKEIANE